MLGLTQSLFGEGWGRVTKLLLVPMAPLQYLLDVPAVLHGYCLEEACSILQKDGKEDVVSFFTPYLKQLTKGLLWADRGWKNVFHFYKKPEESDSPLWPGAAGECQYYFNKALSLFDKDAFKGMFYLGAALHLIQDMCVPHHAIGIVFDGHQEFERWATEHWREFRSGSGLYLNFNHPVQWIEYNAKISETYYSLVSSEQQMGTEGYAQAASELVPLTMQSTAGFLDFAMKRLEGLTLELR